MENCKTCKHWCWYDEDIGLCGYTERKWWATREGDRCDLWEAKKTENEEKALTARGGANCES